MIKKFGIVLGLALLIISCQSVEDQEKNWATAKSKIDGYITKYPAIASELSSQRQDAENAYNLALKESDEDTKIEKMGTAISQLRRAPLATIESFEHQIRKTEEIIIDIKDDFTSEEFGNKTLFLIEQATPVINECKEALKAEYSNGQEALQVFEAKKLELRAAAGDLTSHYDEIMEKKREAEEQREAEIAAQKEEVKAESKTVEKPKETAVAKCKKCGTKSTAGTTKCKSCGASL